MQNVIQNAAKAAENADDPDGNGLDEIDRGLARLDPLTVRPRISSCVLCVVFGLIMLVAAGVVWYLGVCTADGQSYEDMVYIYLSDVLPGWFNAILGVFAISLVVQIVSFVFAVGALAIAIARKRWWLIGQSVAFAILCFLSSRLKYVLERPFLINTESNGANSAPSGHTILAAAAGIALLVVVPRAWRAVAAVVGAVYSILVGTSVITSGWHRPADVVMSLLIVGGLALLALAFTRTSGMDAPGSRMSSASVQIVGTVMITAGILCCLYSAYIIYQIQPGLELSAEWSRSGACVSTMTLISGVSLLVFGLVLAMRQLTASPLTKLGLIGAPPAPPRQ